VAFALRSISVLSRVPPDSVYMCDAPTACREYDTTVGKLPVSVTSPRNYLILPSIK